MRVPTRTGHKTLPRTKGEVGRQKGIESDGEKGVIYVRASERGKHRVKERERERNKKKNKKRRSDEGERGNQSPNCPSLARF